MLTPSLPERSGLLSQCKQSVEAQTVPVVHLVALDEKGAGPQALRNQLALTADTEWLLPVDDDDLLDPDCVEVLLNHSQEADVVYPWTRMQGRTDWNPNRLFYAKHLFRRNFIPNTALIRTDLFRMLNGYRQTQLEDWDLWQRAYLHGARFVCVPEVLWSYRFHDGNQFQKAA